MNNTYEAHPLNIFFLNLKDKVLAHRTQEVFAQITRAAQVSILSFGQGFGKGFNLADPSR